MMVAPRSVVRLPFLRIVTATSLPVAGEHHRVGLLYSHSVTTDGAVSRRLAFPATRHVGRLCSATGNLMHDNQ